MNIAGLRECLPRLPLNSRNFAESLLRAYDRYGSLTSKQEPWVDRLIERANNADSPEKSREQVGNLSAIMSLFDRAKKHLKHPAIVINIRGVGDCRINVAGQRARVPGSLNVATNESYGDSKWFGRIHRDGSFEASNREATPDSLLPELRRFAADPAGVAAEHGKLTGRCCFCDRKLTDSRSAAVGYGETCADHYGMPWGVRPAKGDLFLSNPEAEADREQTIRDERAKHEARASMESGSRWIVS